MRLRKDGGGVPLVVGKGVLWENGEMILSHY